MIDEITRMYPDLKGVIEDRITYDGNHFVLNHTYKYNEKELIEKMRKLNNLRIEEQKRIDEIMNEKEDPSQEYYKRWGEIKREEPKSFPKKNTQAGKDFFKKRAIEKAKYKKTGYEYFDPLDPNL